MNGSMLRGMLEDAMPKFNRPSGNQMKKSKKAPAKKKSSGRASSGTNIQPNSQAGNTFVRDKIKSKFGQ